MTDADAREVTTAPSKHLPAEIKADSLAGDLHAECPCGWVGVRVKLLSSALIDHAAHAERAAALAAAEARGVERGYRRAVDRLRDEKRYRAWDKARNAWDPRTWLDQYNRETAAAYLEAVEGDDRA